MFFITAQISSDKLFLAKEAFVDFKFLFYFNVFINKFCSSFLVIKLCADEVRQTDMYTE